MLHEIGCVSLVPWTPFPQASVFCSTCLAPYFHFVGAGMCYADPSMRPLVMLQHLGQIAFLSMVEVCVSKHDDV